MSDTKKTVTQAEALEILKGSSLPLGDLDAILPFVTNLEPCLVHGARWRALKDNGVGTTGELDAVFQAKAKRFIIALLEQNRAQATACGEVQKALTEKHEAAVKALKEEWVNEVHGLALEIEDLKSQVAMRQQMLDAIKAAASSTPEPAPVATLSVEVPSIAAETAAPQA